MSNNTSRLDGETDVPEYVNEILLRKMNERRIYPWSVPDRLSRQKVRGHGKAVCPDCRHSWTSYKVSGEVDLKQQRVMRVWKQKCKDCFTAVGPMFRDYEFEVVVEKMLNRYEAKLRGETPSVREDDGSGPPRRKDLREGCGYGTRDCRARADTSDINSVVRTLDDPRVEEIIKIGVTGVALLGNALSAALKPDEPRRNAGTSNSVVRSSGNSREMSDAEIVANGAAGVGLLGLAFYSALKLNDK